MQGLWTVEFGSSLAIPGNGIVVFQNDGKLMGGDAGYYFLGKYTLDGTALNATLKVTEFSPGSASFFKAMGQKLALEISGARVDGAHVIAQGHPEGKPHLRFEVKLTKRT